MSFAPRANWTSYWIKGWRPFITRGPGTSRRADITRSRRHYSTRCERRMHRRSARKRPRAHRSILLSRLAPRPRFAPHTRLATLPTQVIKNARTPRYRSMAVAHVALIRVQPYEMPISRQGVKHAGPSSDDRWLLAAGQKTKTIGRSPESCI